MYGLTKKEKLNFILEKVKEMEITAYDIAKNTTLTEAGVLRIINRTSKNPQENSLNAILLYLESKQTGKNYHTNTTQNNKQEEPHLDNFNKKESDLRELVECKHRSEKLIFEVIRLQNLLRKNNIEFENFFDLE
ncbi:hypothetical protein [Flavobacterium johnsoniae]|uniref:Uncharacterized protein n=1 Tax=Flavobacterium johnsoniae TaxID=986 RepID=A0A1M5IKJ6_FLAJO|nr:hypothetical protein [Flavobacterium johnsoniae]SHG28559.1 hypothetical protein SAMN05444388_102134 [Flavobacterium johnsoniae]